MRMNNTNFEGLLIVLLIIALFAIYYVARRHYRSDGSTYDLTDSRYDWLKSVTDDIYEYDTSDRIDTD